MTTRLTTQVVYKDVTAVTNPGTAYQLDLVPYNNPTDFTLTQATKGVLVWSIGAGTGTGSTCTIAVKGRWCDDDAWAVVATLTQASQVNQLISLYPLMRFDIAAINADGGTGVRLAFTYPKALR